MSASSGRRAARNPRFPFHPQIATRDGRLSQKYNDWAVQAVSKARQRSGLSSICVGSPRSPSFAELCCLHKKPIIQLGQLEVNVCVCVCVCVREREREREKERERERERVSQSVSQFRCAFALGRDLGPDPVDLSTVRPDPAA